MSGQQSDGEWVQVEPPKNLYDAVSTGDNNIVKAILEQSSANLSIWNDTRTDTVLAHAAAKGYFDIFNTLLEHHEKYPKSLPGLRSSQPNNAGNAGRALNYCLRHLSDEDCTINSQKYKALCESIRLYLRSITQVPSLSIPFRTYTSMEDEYNLTPMDYLASNKGAALLKSLGDIKASGFLSMITGHYYTINDIFDLRKSGQQDKTIMQVAAENGDVDFVTVLYDISQGVYSKVEYTKELVRAKLGQNPDYNTLKVNTCKAFLQLLEQEKNKSEEDVTKITLLKQLIYGDNCIVSQQWLDCVEKHFLGDELFCAIRNEFASVDSLAQNQQRFDANYGVMLELRIKINIELEKIATKIAEVVDDLQKKYATIPDMQALCEPSSQDIRNAFENGAKLQYGVEENRDDASTQTLDNYKQKLVRMINPNARKNTNLNGLMRDIQEQKFTPITEEQKYLANIANQFNNLESTGGAILMLFGNLQKIQNSTNDDQRAILVQQFDIMMEDPDKLLNSNVSNLFRDAMTQVLSKSQGLKH